MPVTGQRYEADADLGRLKDHPRNPRRGADSAVASSIDRNGWYGAIVAQASTGLILAGHTRRRVLAAAGETTGPVLWVDCDDETATRILLADNRTAELAAWSEAELLELLTEMDPTDLGALGFGVGDIETLTRQVDASQHGELDRDRYAQEWERAGMPGYESEDKYYSHFRTTVHFRSEKDVEDFFRLLERPRAKYLWWPVPDEHVGYDTRTEVTAEQT